MRPTDWLFPIATLAPAALIAAACLSGGGAALAALAAMTVLVAAMDLMLRLVPPPQGAEFPAGRFLSLALAALHFPLLALGLAALAGATGLGAGARAALFLALGMWLGQVSNANAHELIHRGSRRLVTLGTWVYVTLLFGHHASAHPKVHHVWVGSARDPNTARLGESFHRFALRAWAGSFRDGWRAETALLRRRAGAAPAWRHPYALYLGGALACLGAAGAAFGAAGLAWYLALAGYAQMQLLLSDYVQHYGLLRRETAAGRLEPVGPAHSWNAAPLFSGALMLNGARHSDHHASPGKSFDRLDLPGPDEAPRMPYALPVMAAIALWPRQWKRLMDRRARAWREGGPALAA